MGALEGKVAIITGGASGMGAASARLFAEAGARVLLADRQDAKGEAVAAEIRANGGDAHYQHADVAVSGEVAALTAAAAARWGRLDVMFNNAGVATIEGSLADSDEGEFDRIVAVDLKGVYLGMKHAIPHMLAGGGGAIVSTSSICAAVGLPQMAAYSASKAGVLALTRVAAVEYASRGIRANCICPGFIATPMLFRDSRIGGEEEEKRAGMTWMQPIRRPGEARDIAEAALWLASDASSFVTGQEIFVDGGFAVDGRRPGPPLR